MLRVPTSDPGPNPRSDPNSHPKVNRGTMVIAYPGARGKGGGGRGLKGQRDTYLGSR